MDAIFPIPKTTLVILLGASGWPRYPELEASQAFSNAARELTSYFLNPREFNLPQENLLNLFDSNESADRIDDLINQFLEKHIEEKKKAKRPTARDILLYFIGHGYISDGNSDFHLAIRGTRQSNPEVSSLSIKGLAKTLKEQSRFQRHIIILDCCFAASAVKFYQGTGVIDIMRMSMNESFEGSIIGDGYPGRGTSFICSSSSKTRSRITQDETSTMFTQAFLHVLRTGHPSRKEKALTLDFINFLTRDFLIKKHGKEVPKPEVHSPDQCEGNIATMVAFFPNPQSNERTGSSTRSQQDVLDTIENDDTIDGEYFNEFKNFGVEYPGSDSQLQQKGSDVEINVEITSQEASVGTTRIFAIDSRGQDAKQIEVKIPSNVSTGTRIRIAGKGRYGIGGGARGDLFLVITVKLGSVSHTRQVDEPSVPQWSAAGSRAVGIHLGTTNSSVAVMVNGEPVIIPSSEGTRTIPSIVAMNKNGERLVGELAKRQAVTNPDNTIYSIKRFMGRKYDDPEVDRDIRQVSYKVVRARNGDAWVEVYGKQYSPSEISAMILQKLRMDAEAYLGERVGQAVITVPAYFNDAQEQATKDAAQIAGLKVLHLIREPIAVSVAYGFDRNKSKHITVYHLGGRTCSVSILELSASTIRIRSSLSYTNLGGNDFDDRIVNWLADTFLSKHGIDLRQDHVALQRVREAAENAKKELSISMETDINLPFLTANASGPKHLNVTLSRAKLEQLVEDLIEKSRNLVSEALVDASIPVSDIQQVVVSGGQTHMPAVKTLVWRLFNCAPDSLSHPDEAAAIGAAIQSAVISNNTRQNNQVASVSFEDDSIENEYRNM